MPTRKDRYLVYLLLPLLALLLSGLVWRGAATLTPDSCSYIDGGLSLISGRGYMGCDGQPETCFPPGYPILIGMANKMTGNPILAGRIVSVFASALAMIPLFLIAGHLFGRKTALWTCAVYAIIPTRLVLSNMVMTESLYVLVIMQGAWLWIRETQEHRLIRAIAVGCLFGFAYLVRPEGFLCAVVLFSLSLLIRRWCNVPIRRSTLLSVLAMLVVVSPYIVYIHGQTGKWTLSTKFDINRKLAVGRSAGVPWDVLLRELGKPETSQKYTHETITHMAKRYRHNLRLEGSSLREIMGILLCACTALGIASAVGARRKQLLSALPIIVSIGAPLVFLPLMYVETRYVYVAAIPLLMLGCWFLVVHFAPSSETQDVATRSRMAAVLPLVLILLTFAPSVRSQAHRQLPYDSLREISVSAWVREAAPDQSMIMTLNPIICFLLRTPLHDVPRRVPGRCNSIRSKKWCALYPAP